MRTTRALAALLLAAAIAGCGDDDQARNAPTPSATPQATPASVPTLTPLPLACVQFCVGTCDLPGEECTDCTVFDGDSCVCRCVPDRFTAPCFDDGSQGACGGECETGPCIRLGFDLCGCPTPTTE